MTTWKRFSPLLASAGLLLPAFGCPSSGPAAGPADAGAAQPTDAGGMGVGERSDDGGSLDTDGGSSSGPAEDAGEGPNSGDAGETAIDDGGPSLADGGSSSMDGGEAENTVDDSDDGGSEDEAPADETMFSQCAAASDCDDGSACTTDSCEDGACIHSAHSDCDWPAEGGADVTNLTSIEGPFWDNDFHSDLSGAVYNPVSERLWLVRNNGPSKVWAVVQDGSGDYVIDEADGERAEWEEFDDAEAITQADFDDEFTVFVLSEWGTVREFDLSTYGEKVLVNEWPINNTGNNNGPEGMTFVPDAFLAAQGFVDASGVPYASAQGMGGLFFVGMQGNGQIAVYDFNRETGAAVLVGEYLTGEEETAGLEFDRSTGQLFIWHDDDIDVLEVTRLSSSEVEGGRRLDTLVTYEAPSTTLLQTTNREGFALAPVEECVDGKRRAWMTTDGGRTYSLLMFEDFPC